MVFGNGFVLALYALPNTAWPDELVLLIGRMLELTPSCLPNFNNEIRGKKTATHAAGERVSATSPWKFAKDVRSSPWMGWLIVSRMS